MTELKKEDIENVINGILSHSKNELLSLKQTDLDRYWFFKYNKDKSREWNLYEFTKMLDLYRRQCRQWEEHHNGSACVVERVRDTYLMPRIKQFIEDFEQ